MLTRALITALVMLSSTAAATLGQVVAKQGEALPSPDKHFDSPMILELPLPNVASLDDHSSLRLADVRHYICDSNVSLLNLTVSKQHRGTRKSRSLEIVVAGTVWVAASYDRRVDIAVALRSGETNLASNVLRNQSAEEERLTSFRVSLPVDESRLATALAAAPSPTLVLTVTVRDDS